MAVTPDVIGDALGRPLSDSEATQAALWIGDAEMMIRIRLGDLDQLDQEVLSFVVREAALARLRNPEGFSSETIDNYTYRLPGETRRVTILPEWWAMLAPATGFASVRPRFVPDCLP